MMEHLTRPALEDAVENALTGKPAQHLAGCAVCQARVSRARRLEAALTALPRANQPGDLSGRILAALPASPPASLPLQRLGIIAVAAFIAALLALAFVYQTAFDLQASGALDLLGVYSAQPDIVRTYPNEAVGALLERVPWLTAGVALGVAAVGVLLAQQLVALLGYALDDRGHSRMAM